MSDAICVRGLTKSYSGRTVLNRLDLSVKAGTVFGLLGANGAGKSTLLKCIDRICHAQEGSVAVDGKDVFSMHSSEMAQKIMV